MLLYMDLAGVARDLGVTSTASPPRATVSATRGGAQLAAATVVSLVANYLFLLGAGRLLGSRDYSTLAALTGLLTVVLLPSGALQMAVSREVSRHEALGEEREAAAFVRALILLGLKVTVPLVAVAVALILPLRHLLNIDSSAAVGLAFVSLVVALLAPIAFGVLQGYQRFRTLAFASAAPMIVRLGLLIILAVVGLRLYGAIAALTASALAGGAIGLIAIRDRGPANLRVPAPSLRPFLRYLWPVAVGLFAISLLTNADILIVKARFPAHDAGVYASASAFARIAFFLPSTILAVLFPRTAARVARGERSEDILGRSIIVTVGFCALLTAFYAVAGHQLVRLSFGAQFAGAANLLVLFCVAMTLFSLTNVFVGYHLSRGDNRFAWMVSAGVVLQLGLLATTPTTLRGVLWVDAGVGAALVLTHELVMGSSAAALRSGFRRFELGAIARRWLAVATGLRASVFEASIVLASFSALAVAITWPLAAHLNSRLPGVYPNDGLGTASWFWQLQHEGGYHFLGTTHHTLTGAPLGWDQGNALNFQWLWPYYPAYLLSTAVGAVAALNVVTFTGFAFSGGAMYLLIRKLGCGRVAAWWAGVVWVVFPWHMQRALAGHASLTHIEAFPLLLLACLAWARRPSDGRAIVVGLAVVFAWLTSGYFGVMALLALIPVAIAGSIRHRRELGASTALRKGVTLWGISLVGAGAVGGVAVLAGGTAGISIGRSAGNISFFGAHLRSYLPDPMNPFAGAVAKHLDAGLTAYPGAEGRLYPGLLTVALAASLLASVLLRRAPERRALAATLGALLVVGVAFAMPDPVSVFGMRLHPMPSYLLFKVIPSFRVPSRMVALTVLALVPLAALALDRIVRAVVGAARSRETAVVVVAGLFVAVCGTSVAELAVIPFPVTGGVLPAEYTMVAETPVGVLAEYPLQSAATFSNSSYIYWQRRHGRLLLNGGSLGTPADDLRRMLVDPAAPGTAASLAALGVTAIVTRPTTYDWAEGMDVPDTSTYGPGYSLLRSVADGTRVWRVRASPAPAIAVFRGAAVADPPLRERDGTVAYALTGRVVQTDIYARAAGVWRLVFWVRRPGDAHELTISGSTNSRTVRFGRQGLVSVLVAVPAGRSVVRLALARAPGYSKQLSTEAPALSGPRFLPPGPGGLPGLRPTLISQAAF